MKATTGTFRSFSPAIKIGIMFVGLLALAAIALPALAQVGGGYDLTWNTIDGGGGTFSTGGAYSMGGTIGQPDAGDMSGGTFGVNGGFWGAMAGTSQVVGHVNWQGRPAQPNALQTLPVTLTLKLGTAEVNYPSQATDASGFFTVSVSNMNGSFGWRVKGPKYLANTGTALLSGGAITQVDMGLMKVGDANNDNLVNISDFNILKQTFGKASGDPGYDDRAEFNGDLIVSITDFNLIKQNFGSGGAPPLAPDGK